MIKLLKNFLYELKLLWPFGSTSKELALTRITGRFDVVRRVPVYTRIKF
jgi:hypothetical protein